MKRRNYLKTIGLLLLGAAFLFNEVVVAKVLSCPAPLKAECIYNIRSLQVLFLALGLFFFFLRKMPAALKVFLSSSFLCLLALEIVLRINPLLLGDVFANKVLTKYHTLLTGIYEYDSDLHMNFMKPNFTATNYFGRRRWTHRTDGYGFRNPQTRKKADILLLGDSFIYGHGAEHHQTVGYFLEELAGHSVVNMARQGDCSREQAYVLNQYGIAFEPRYVFYFFYENDLMDLHAFLSREQIEEFARTPVGEITFSARKEHPYNAVPSNLFSEFVDNGFYSVTQLGKFMRHLLRQKRQALNPPTDQETTPQSLHKAQGDSMEWQYTQKAILQMKHVSDAHAIRFVIVPIPVNMEYFSDMLITLAKTNKIDYIDTRDMAHKGEFFLPHDGHFTEEGARAMAEKISGWMKAN